MALASMPGACSGPAWLGVTVPQLPWELPPPIRPASITCTLRPRSSSCSALARPTTPAPTTMTSLPLPAAPSLTIAPCPRLPGSFGRVAPARPSRPAHHAPGRGTGMRAVAHHLHAVDEHVRHAGRVAVRLLERGVIGDGGRIEHHDVGVAAG